jgi:hypothetical protein
MTILYTSLQPSQSIAHTCVADSRVVDLDTDFMRLGRRDLDVLERKVLSGFPCHCCLLVGMDVSNDISIYLCVYDFGAGLGSVRMGCVRFFSSDELTLQVMVCCWGRHRLAKSPDSGVDEMTRIGIRIIGCSEHLLFQL